MKLSAHENAWALVMPKPAALKILSQRNCEKCYTLTLNADGTLTGHTSTNDMSGKYEVDVATKKIKFIQVEGTKINELLNGKKYVEAKKHSIGGFTSVNNKGTKETPEGFAHIKQAWWDLENSHINAPRTAL